MPPDNLLPSRRRYLADRADRERAYGVEWVTSFDSRVRARLYSSFMQSLPSHDPDMVDRALERTAEIVRAGTELYLSAHTFQRATDSEWGPASPDEEYVDWLAGAGQALASLAEELNGLASADHEYSYTIEFDPAGFFQKANDIFLERRIAYTFVDSVLIQRESEPLHVDVIEPVEALLTSLPRFAAAETAYNEAMMALAGGQYGASITSAASALQETLLAVGARGNDLGALVADANRRGLLLPHDEKLYRAFKSIAEWVTADRSNRGTAHGASTAVREDADLAIHVVAAAIIRLIKLYGDAPDRNDAV